MEFFWRAVGAFGGLAAIAVASAGAAYWLFQTFSERWLQAKFDARLEALKHEQNKELERLRFQINSMMDRASRMHGHEYRAMPEIWDALVVAWGNVASYVSPFQQDPNLYNLTKAQLEEFLSSTPLTETQRQHVRESSSPMQAYREAIYFHKKAEVHDRARALSRVISTHAIFLPEELISPLRRLEDLLWEALEEHAMNQEHQVTPRERTAFEALKSDGKPLLASIERLFHERMLSSPDIR